jgi:beta-lactamase class C
MRVPRCRATPILALLCGCASPPAADAAPDADRIASIVASAVRPLLEEHRAPGLAVAVTVGARQYFCCLGVADRQQNTPVTPDTLFEIGSVSKTFTATLACYAAVRGVLSLDDHPGQHVPELRGCAIDAARLLHLGTYTAGGLPLQFPADVGDAAAMVLYFREWQPSAPPGTARCYSNPSIGLLGHVVARASQRSFSDLLEGELLPGLGLRHCHLRVPESDLGDYAWGYDGAGKPLRVGPGVLDAEAYGIKASAADLIRFVELNLRPELLAPPFARAVAATHVGWFRSGEMIQGLGWELYPFPIALDRLLDGNARAISTAASAATALTPPRALTEPTLFQKTGSTAGFGAYVAFVPSRQLGVVLLANQNVPIPLRIAAVHRILAQLDHSS